MAVNTVEELVDAIFGAGVVVIGREHIPGLVAANQGEPQDQLLMLIAQGRALGVYFYLDQSVSALEAIIQLSHKLGTLGLPKEYVIQLLVNIAPTSYAELKNMRIGS